jgi:Ca2+/H+ antiporter
MTYLSDESKFTPLSYGGEKTTRFLSLMLFAVFTLIMPMSCDINGTKCKKFPSEGSKGDHNVLGYILGSIASSIFVLLVLILMYMLCGKRYLQRMTRIRFRSSSQSPTRDSTIHLGQRPMELNVSRMVDPQSTYDQEIKLKKHGQSSDVI